MTTTKEKNSPSVGMGATSGFNGDAYPYTVIEVLSPKTIAVTQDNHRVIEKDAGFKEGSIECEFETNWYDEPIFVTKRKNGRWVQKGQDMWSAFSFVLGKRIYARNPHF
jgi:hypothetical protein